MDTTTSADTALILAAHGSRNGSWGHPLEALTASVRAELGAGAMRLAYVQFGTPSLNEAVLDAAAAGARTIRVLPLFMTRDGHVERDIRPLIADLRMANPDLEIELLPPVGESAAFRDALIGMAKEALS
jgi:sirohydrochlorin cobaltochelatase